MVCRKALIHQHKQNTGGGPDNSNDKTKAHLLLCMFVASPNAGAVLSFSVYRISLVDLRFFQDRVSQGYFLPLSVILAHLMTTSKWLVDCIVILSFPEKNLCRIHGDKANLIIVAIRQ